MYDHIAVIEQKPAFLRLTLHAAPFPVIFFRCFEHAFGEGIEHAVTSAVADDEIISKRCNIFDVKKQDVFALFVPQGVDDFMCEFECVQISPHKVCSNDLCRYYFG